MQQAFHTLGLPYFFMHSSCKSAHKRAIALELTVEPVHLRDLPRLVVSSEKRDLVRISDCQLQPSPPEAADLAL